VTHADGTPDTGEDHLPWTVTADTNGYFSTTWHVCEDDCVGSTLLLTAIGPISGTNTAQFTDAINLQSRDSTCTIVTNLFSNGDIVCMRATGIGGQGDQTGEFKWWAPGLDPDSDPATRTQSFTTSTGNVSDSFQVTVCGTWTVKVYQPAGTLQDTNTFVVTNCP